MAFRRILLWLGISAFLLLMTSPGLNSQGKGKGGGGTTGSDSAIVTIVDAFAGSGAGVLSDEGGVYTDSRLDGGDPCVTAYVKADGFFRVDMDFNRDTGFGCNMKLQTVPAGTARTYRLRFPDGHAACGEFNLPTNGTVCELTLDAETDAPAIGIPKLFSATLSQVRFPFVRDGVPWVVASHPDFPVAVDPSQNPQTVTHVGPFRLFREVKGKGGGQVGGDFTFALSITVERIPQ